MKLLKAISYIVFLFFLFINIQCSSTKYQLQETPISINPSHAYFQEWYGGIKVGGYGFNVYLANLNSKDEVLIDSIFFRRMRGKLIKNGPKYTAILKKPTRHYENISSVYQEDNKKLDKKTNFPFELANNECVISYKEAGQTKYMKVQGMQEKQSIYYKSGPPVTLN